MVRTLAEERASREEEIVTKGKLRQVEMEQWEKLVSVQMLEVYRYGFLACTDIRY